MEDTIVTVNNDIDDESSSSSFVDLVEENNDDVNSNVIKDEHNHSSSSFEIQAKADEWMDVTPKEELLQKELDRFKEAFEKCSNQLESSRLENELLKSQQKELHDENQKLHDQKLELRETLNESERRSTNEIDRLEQSAAKTKNEFESRIECLTEKVEIANGTNGSLRTEIDTKRKEHEQIVCDLRKEVSTLKKENAKIVSIHQAETTRLQRELKDMKADRNTHRESAVKFAEDLRKTKDVERGLRSELNVARKAITDAENKLKESKTTTGSIATLAESLKVEKHALERKLNHTNQSEKERTVKFEKTLEENTTLQERLTETERLYTNRNEELELELHERIQDLDGSNRSIEMLQIELKDSEQLIKELSSKLDEVSNEKQELVERSTQTQLSSEEMQTKMNKSSKLIEKLSLDRDNLRKHLSLMEQGRHEFLEQQSNLEERLLETELLLEESLSNNATKNGVDEFERRLFEQKRMFESRLKDIHSILGLKFTTAVQSQVEEFHSKAIAMKMPESFRVPLMTAHHHHHPAVVHVKSV